MYITVKVLPEFSMIIASIISLILYIAIIGLGIFMFIKIINATKDIKKMREDMN